MRDATAQVVAPNPDYGRRQSGGQRHFARYRGGVGFLRASQIYTMRRLICFHCVVSFVAGGVIWYFDAVPRLWAGLVGG